MSLDMATVAATSAVTSSVVAVLLVPLYKFTRKVDNLCALHTQRYPEDASLLDQPVPAQARQQKRL
jgi:hypothetical protein